MTELTTPYIYAHIGASIAYILSAVIILNWVVIIYRLCKDDGLNARQPKAVIFAGILLIISHVICIPYALISRIFIDDWISALIEQVNVWVFILPPPLILLCRTFNIYFRIKYHINLESNEWKKLITVTSNDLDKLSKFYHRFVQKNHIYYIIFSTYIAIGSIYLVLWCLAYIWDIQISQSILYALLLVQSIPNFIGYIEFAIILPKYEDIFGIRKETQYLAIFWPIMMIKSAIILYFTQSNEELHYIISALAGLPANIGIMSIVLCYPLRILNLPKWFWKVSPYIISLFNKHKIEVGYGHYEIDLSNNLSHMWNNPNLLNSFAIYCLREFSIENIIFLIEANEFNNALYKLYHYKRNKKRIENTIPNKRFKLKKHIPKSAIINNINISDQTEQYTKLRAFVGLFIKYCFVNSQFSINISYESRERLHNLFGFKNMKCDINLKYAHEILMDKLKNNNDLDINELCFLFDDSIKEITKLVEYKFNKYKNTKGYQVYLKEISKMSNKL